MARNSLFCADVPLRNYSLTHSTRGVDGRHDHLAGALDDHNDAADAAESWSLVLVSPTVADSTNFHGMPPLQVYKFLVQVHDARSLCARHGLWELQL